MTQEFRIERSSASANPYDSDIASVIGQCAEYVAHVENEAKDTVLRLLDDVKNHRQRSESDRIFGVFSDWILKPLANNGMASRAALFAASSLIPAVLAKEAQTNIDYHKGALFYDTALAFLVTGDEDRFEYFLAMADEEDHRTCEVEGGNHPRGTTTMRMGDLSAATIEPVARFALSVVNGSLSNTGCTYECLFGTPLDAATFRAWRSGLTHLHHYELFRFLKEVRVFTGEELSEYQAVLDNPYVLLRLAKGVAHAAQWNESYLTDFQKGTVKGSGLSAKLNGDTDLDSLKNAAGGGHLFAGNCPHGVDIGAELTTLIGDISTQTAFENKAWRVLRVTYIVRNSTAHRIEEALDYYKDRPFVLSVFQAVLISAFVIHHLKK